MNQHQQTLNLLRNYRHLTPAQQLEVIEHAAARQQQRAQSTRRILGIGALCAVTSVLTLVNSILALGAIAVGIAGALIWSWNSAPEGKNSVASFFLDAKTNDEEKIAPRHRDSPAS